MPGCAAFGCSNRSERGFSMIQFPRDPERRAAWVDKVKRDEDWTPSKNSCLCDAHFDAGQWEKVRVDGSHKLKRFAIPTIFPEVELKSSKTKRKPQLKCKEETIQTKAFPPSPCEGIKEESPDHGYATSHEEMDPTVYLQTNFEEGQWEDGSRKPNWFAIPTSFSHVENELNSLNSKRKSQSENKGETKTLTPSPCEVFNQVGLSNDHRYATRHEEPSEETDDIVATEDNLTKDIEYENDEPLSDDSPSSKKDKIRVLEERVQILRKRSREASVEKSKNRIRVGKAAKCFEEKLKFLNNDQIESMSYKKTNGFKWSNETVQKALQLRLACGTAGYEELLKQKYPLPSMRTLRRKLQHTKSESSGQNVSE